MTARRLSWKVRTDALFDAHDPKLFEKMIEYSAEGFKALLPAALAKFPEIDKDGYNYHMAGVVYRTMEQGNVLNTFLGMGSITSEIVMN